MTAGREEFYGKETQTDLKSRSNRCFVVYVFSSCSPPYVPRMLTCVLCTRPANLLTPVFNIFFCSHSLESIPKFRVSLAQCHSNCTLHLRSTLHTMPLYHCCSVAAVSGWRCQYAVSFFIFLLTLVIHFYRVCCLALSFTLGGTLVLLGCALPEFKYVV